MYIASIKRHTTNPVNLFLNPFHPRSGQQMICGTTHIVTIVNTFH